jgi:Transcriptional regulator containing an amidase domain and an AraC-type DNA-binding HTH domain
MIRTRNVAILIFDDVEVLDFCGPFEVFSVTNQIHSLKPFNVYTVAEHDNLVIAANNLSVNPRYTITNCPKPDIILVPGGQGTRKEMNNPVLINWIKESFDNLELLLSVCTGALILAKAELLEGLTATTHHNAFDILKKSAPHTKIVKNERFVDNGKIILSAGISAGIDMSFYVVEKLLNKEAALETSKYMEYNLSL